MNRIELGSDDLLNLAAEVFSRGGSLSLHVTGHSMVPEIANGDTVSLRAKRYEWPKMNEIWLAATGQGARLHRIVACGRDRAGSWYLLQGDAEVLGGQWVRRADLLACVV